MLLKMKNIFCISLLSLLLLACESEPKPKKNRVPKAKELVEMNKAMIKAERIQIDKFIERKGWKMEETGSGLRFWQYWDGFGDSIKVGQEVEMNLIVTLLNGDTCYSYKSYGSEKFVVERQSMETGLHEAVQLMQRGAKAKVILPSHLAHGVTGDMNKIPQRSTVIYDVEILDAK
jgi:FKBP-type peptidyl-prolyl cis-trans isomerase